MTAGIERRTFYCKAMYEKRAQRTNGMTQSSYGTTKEIRWRYGKRSESLSDHLKESKEHNNNFVKKNQGGKNTRYKK